MNNKSKVFAYFTLIILLVFRVKKNTFDESVKLLIYKLVYETLMSTEDMIRYSSDINNKYE